MNINRHNYETFFILYWDEELPAEQRKNVEIFVQDNPDLEEEFRLYGKTRMTPDPSLTFGKKNSLFFKSTDAVHPGNYQELLLSFIDDELTSVQKKQLEQYIASRPAVQKELTLLQKTKLLPDVDIVFQDKSVLYRQTEKAKVTSLSWRKVAIAASILLMAGLTTFIISKNNTQEQPGFVVAPASGINAASPVKPVPDINLPDQQPTEKKLLANRKIKPAALQPQDAANPMALISPDNKNNLPKEKRMAEQPVIAEIKSPATTAELDLADRKKPTTEIQTVAIPEITNPLFENSSVTERTSPSYTIYTDPANVNKNENNGGGLKGFLRKATRVIEHRTKVRTTTDDNKLLVGVFAVSLK